MTKLLASSLLVLLLFAAACADPSTEQEPAVVADIRRYLREQDVPAEVTDNGNTLTVTFRVALIE